MISDTLNKKSSLRARGGQTKFLELLHIPVFPYIAPPPRRLKSCKRPWGSEGASIVSGSHFYLLVGKSVQIYSKQFFSLRNLKLMNRLIK